MPLKSSGIRQPSSGVDSNEQPTASPVLVHGTLAKQTMVPFPEYEQCGGGADCRITNGTSRCRAAFAAANIDRLVNLLAPLAQVDVEGLD
jgi:hypothetical protein